MGIGGEPFSRDFLSEFLQLRAANPTLQESPGIYPRASMALDVDRISETIILTSEYVVESDFIKS